MICPGEEVAERGHCEGKRERQRANERKVDITCSGELVMLQVKGQVYAECRVDAPGREVELMSAAAFLGSEDVEQDMRGGTHKEAA